MQRHVQRGKRAAPAGQRVQEEIHNFFRALDSYPDRVAKEPNISFRQHLCSFFALAPPDREPDREQVHRPD